MLGGGEQGWREIRLGREEEGGTRDHGSSQRLGHTYDLAPAAVRHPRRSGAENLTERSLQVPGACS